LAHIEAKRQPELSAVCTRLAPGAPQMTRAGDKGKQRENKELLRVAQRRINLQDESIDQK